MVLINRLAISLLLLSSLTLTVQCATPEPVQVPLQRTIRLVPPHSAEDVMRHELRRFENDQTLNSFEIARGALSAQLVILSPHYVARLSASLEHRIEADRFDILARTIQIEGATLDNIGFKLCLPLSVMLVADPADSTGAKTSASIVLMPRAQGNPLYTYLSSGVNDSSKSRILFDLGKTLARFQTAFMTPVEGEFFTACHGDFHEGNIMCAPQLGPRRTSSKWAFSLIDCSGMSTNGIHPLMDPLYFIYRASYSLFRDPATSHDLFSLAKSFYSGYLGHLPVEVNRSLHAQVPNWRHLATVELAKTKGLMFFSEGLPNAQSFLAQFEPLHQAAVNSVFSDLGYNLALPPSYQGKEAPGGLPCCGAAAAPQAALMLPCCAAGVAQKPAILIKQEEKHKGLIHRLRQASKRLVA